MGWGILSYVLGGALVLILLSAGIEDARTREIANWKNAAIALMAPAWWWVLGYGWADVAWQVGIAVGVFALFVGAFHFGWMGGGDVKMIGALALWLPFQALLAMLTVMALAGGVITIFLLVRHRFRPNAERPEVPYGVAIAIGGLWVIANGLLTTSVA